VKQLRERRGATQEGLAYEAGITTGTLSQLERGISNPSWGTLRAIAGALRVSMVELAKLAAKLES
jgi:transcriptional regulator with XRE-family HTH domain